MSQVSLNKLKYKNAHRKYSKIRQKILLEQQWSPQQGSIFGIFVEPFANVFKALKLTAMDFSNITKMILGTLVGTFLNDYKQIAKVRQSYQSRRSRLRNEWESIVESSAAAISSSDPLLTLMLAPNVYMATKAVQAGVKGGKTATEIIVSEKWDQLVDDFRSIPDEKWGIAALYKKSQEQENGKAEKKPGSEVFSALEKLFYGSTRKDESRLRSKKVLLEDESQQKDNSLPTDAKEWLSQLFSDTGLDAYFDENVAEIAYDRFVLTKNASDAIEEVNAVIAIVAAKTIDEMQKVISEMGSSTASAKTKTAFSNVIQKIDQQAKSLAANEEFKKTAAEQVKKDPSQISEQEYLKAARNAVFAKSKINLDTELMNKVLPVINEIEQTQKVVSIDENTLALLNKKTEIPEVADLLDIYNREKKLYNNLKASMSRLKG